jgi:glycogen operon protein
VKALHAAGLEVILDVVYNHTAEGNHLGPMLAFRGIDNATYYRLVDGQPEFYMDYTGTGNSLNIRHPQTLRLVMDSLRYWTTEMRVDGFRFDLATTLGRAHGAFDGWSSFFAAVHQDPVLRNVKLIAEPWDTGEDGYRLGGFPLAWSEWNGRYRDSVRDFWRGERGAVGEFAARVVGSADIFASGGRPPQASVNFVVSHDGYTLRDLVSYHEKHNEANGENNLDGESTAHAWNLGAEGPTDDPIITARRQRQVRNFLATLLMSLGTPMIAHGDELGRTQSGNNNAYCHDNPLSWIDWAGRDRALEAFTTQLIAFRRQHSLVRTTTWVSGPDAPIPGTPVASWFRPDGMPMTPDDWIAPERAALTLVLQPPDGAVPALCALFAGTLDPQDFVLPAATSTAWRAVIDTVVDHPLTGQRLASGTRVSRPELSLLIVEGTD